MATCNLCGEQTELVIDGGSINGICFDCSFLKDDNEGFPIEYEEE